MLQDMVPEQVGRKPVFICRGACVLWMDATCFCVLCMWLDLCAGNHVAWCAYALTGVSVCPGEVIERDWYDIFTAEVCTPSLLIRGAPGGKAGSVPASA